MPSTAEKLRRETLILETHGGDAGDWWEALAETRAEFQMNWVMGGGRPDDGSLAWFQDRPRWATRMPGWLEAVEAAHAKQIRRRAHQVAVAAPDPDEEPF